MTAFYNGGVNHCSGRNLAPNGCNLGLQYQCVEFVKRYYYEHLHHEMPDSFGHAREFFNAAVADGSRNPQRNLIQHVNGSHSRPRPDDLLVFGPSFWNAYGHVAIVAAVTDSKVEIVQQNPGPFTSSRESLPLSCINGLWSYDNERVLGWLCKEEPSKGL